jgi:hypothetical protein
MTRVEGSGGKPFLLDYFFDRRYARTYSSTPPTHNLLPSIRVGAEAFVV